MRFNIPEFELPGFFSTVGSLLPQWPHGLSLSLALNVLVRMGILAAHSVEQLNGKVFMLVVTDTGSRVRFTCRQGVFYPFFDQNQKPDLTFKANLSSYLQLINRQEDPDTLFFQRRLVVEGDTELGLVAKNMLDAMDLPPRLPLWLERWRQRLLTLNH